MIVFLSPEDLDAEMRAQAFAMTKNESSNGVEGVIWVALPHGVHANVVPIPASETEENAAQIEEAREMIKAAEQIIEQVKTLRTVL